MLLARGDEEITNKASHQVLQEGKYHIYLQLKKIKQRHRSRKNISASFLNDLSSLSRCFWLLAKLFGNSWKDQATQSVGNRRSQGIPAGQHHKEVGKKSPEISFTILCQAPSCQSVAVTALPRGRGAGLLGAQLHFLQECCLERHERRGTGEGKGSEAHPCVDEKVGACFSKINAWSSKPDILPPQAART